MRQNLLDLLTKRPACLPACMHASRECRQWLFWPIMMSRKISLWGPVTGVLLLLLYVVESLAHNLGLSIEEGMGTKWIQCSQFFSRWCLVIVVAIRIWFIRLLPVLFLWRILRNSIQMLSCTFGQNGLVFPSLLFYVMSSIMELKNKCATSLRKMCLRMYLGKGYVFRFDDKCLLLRVPASHVEGSLFFLSKHLQFAICLKTQIPFR